MSFTIEEIDEQIAKFKGEMHEWETEAAQHVFVRAIGRLRTERLRLSREHSGAQWVRPDA